MVYWELLVWLQTSRLPQQTLSQLYNVFHHDLLSVENLWGAFPIDEQFWLLNQISLALLPLCYMILKILL